MINASVTFTKYKTWIEYPFTTCKILVHFLIRKSLNMFSSITYNSTIASNQRRQESNDLAHDLERKTQGSPWALQEPLTCLGSQMWTLTRINKGVIGDYYHVTVMNENVNWMKLTHLQSNNSLNCRVCFCTSTFTSKKFIAILDVYIREQSIPHPCLYCNTPFTLMLVCM